MEEMVTENGRGGGKMQLETAVKEETEIKE